MTNNTLTDKDRLSNSGMPVKHNLYIPHQEELLNSIDTASIQDELKNQFESTKFNQHFILTHSDNPDIPTGITIDIGVIGWQIISGVLELRVSAVWQITGPYTATLMPTTLLVPEETLTSIIKTSWAETFIEEVSNYQYVFTPTSTYPSGSISMFLSSEGISMTGGWASGLLPSAKATWLIMHSDISL